MQNPNRAEMLRPICEADIKVLVDKGASYGPSWRQRGGTGAFMMLARKWDRIENIVRDNHGWDIFKALSENTGDIADDIGDLRRYLLLVEEYVRNGAPDQQESAQVSGALAAVDCRMEIVRQYQALERRHQYEGEYGDGRLLYSCKVCRSRLSGFNLFEIAEKHTCGDADAEYVRQAA
jgi:hypothetical protein